MRLTDSPRLLVLTQSEWNPQGRGSWRFRIEPLGGGRGFEADGEESGCNRDRLDLWAVVRGLESLDQPSQLTLITSSRYVSRGFRFGLTQWRERDWCWERYGRWTAIRDADLWRRVDSALAYHRVDCRLWAWSAMAGSREMSASSSGPATANRLPVDENVQGVWKHLWRRIRRWTAPQNQLDSLTLAAT